MIRLFFIRIIGGLLFKVFREVFSGWYKFMVLNKIEFYNEKVIFFKILF